MRQIVIGLAGHIDHGKTAVVHALTGTNTDKLDEEIRRGMTIDIGFAFLNDEITMIDVPGHEKFVKNMMTGVSSVDAALLVIAADDGVMPQTREHFDILKLLEVKHGIIALNKTDLVDKEWIDLVTADIEEMVAGSFLENAPIVPVSAELNTGFDELKEKLLEICSSIPEKKDRGIFRLWVDRVFTIRGFGTVVTGTVASGSANTGDSVEILPTAKKVKIRGLQTHSKPVEQVRLGDRAAINLQGVEKEEIARGFQISTPGFFQSTDQLAAEISILPDAKKPVIQNQRLRIYSGTQEVMARVAIVDAKSVEPGATQPVLLRLETPLITTKNDRFIVRSYSPVETIGGGIVLDTVIRDKWKQAREAISQLSASDEFRQIELIVESGGFHPITESEFKLRLGLSDKLITELIEKHDSLNLILHRGNRWITTDNQIHVAFESIERFLKNHHKKYKYRAGANREEIRHKVQADERFFDYVLQTMLSEDKLVRDEEFIALPDHSIQLSDDEKTTLVKLISILDKEGFSSSDLPSLSALVGKPEKDVKLLMDISEQSGQVLRLEGSLIFTRNNFEALKQKVIQYFSEQDEMNVAVFKDLAQTTRKYAVPLLEYFDKQKITYRSGNVRKLVQKP